MLGNTGLLAAALRFWGKLGETSRQAGMLFSAYTGSMASGFLISLIQARWMEPEEMGRFAFCLSIIVIGGLFFEFGIFSAGARVLALAGDEASERRALGALIILAIITGVAFALFIAAIAVPIDRIFAKDVRWLLISISAFAFFQPFQWLIEQSCTGLNEIRRLSAFQLLMSGTYLMLLIPLAFFHRLTAASALAAYLIGICVGALWTLVRLRPSFHQFGSYAKVIFREARGFGLNLYLARITGSVSAKIDNLVISYFVPNLAPLGLYAVAQKLSNPISTVSRALATTRFRAFAKLDRVPARVNKWNAIVLITLSVGLVIAGPFVVRHAFPKYVEATPLLLPFAVFSLFAGLFQPYNMFLASHGRGADLRNIAIMVTLASVIGLLLVVPRFGIMGAAWVGAAVMALDYLLNLYYYQRFKRILRNEGGR